MTIAAGAQSGVFEDKDGRLKEALETAKAGTEFTVTEASGEWNPTWNVENATSTDGFKNGLTATGILCYGENTVTFMNYEPNEIRIPVLKKITGDTFKVIPDFQFELSYVGREKPDDSKTIPAEDGITMPNTKLVISGSVFGDNKEASDMFDAIKFTKAGQYKFTVTETAGETEGWTFDSTTWTVLISVTEKTGSNGELEAKIASIKPDNDTADSVDSITIKFTNTYTETRGSLTIKKTVSGGGSEAQEKDYTFTVTGPDGYKETVTIKGAGSYTLSGLLPGSYTVTEADATISGYTWTVEGNNVTAEVKAKETAEVTITNTYAPPPTTPDPDPDPDPDYQPPVTQQPPAPPRPPR